MTPEELFTLGLCVAMVCLAATYITNTIMLCRLRMTDRITATVTKVVDQLLLHGAGKKE